MFKEASGASRLLSFCAAFLVTLWAGSLWTLCVMVAPTLFAILPERRLAGLVAGRLFHLETWLGVVVAILLVGVLAARQAFSTDKAFSAGKAICKSTLGLIVLTAAAPLASELIVGPMLDAARASNDMARFGALHGISAVLLFTACVSALALVWKVERA